MFYGLRYWSNTVLVAIIVQYIVLFSLITTNIYCELKNKIISVFFKFKWININATLGYRIKL